MNNIFPNNPRIYLWVALGMLGLLNYQAWMKDYAPPPELTAASAPPGSSASAHPAATAGTDLASRIPQATPGAAAAPAAATASSAAPAPAEPLRLRLRRACTSRPTCWMLQSAPAAARWSALTSWPMRW